jgi:hypothetical protein
MLKYLRLGMGKQLTLDIACDKPVDPQVGSVFVYLVLYMGLEKFCQPNHGLNKGCSGPWNRV